MSDAFLIFTIMIETFAEFGGRRLVYISIRAVHSLVNDENY